MIFKLAYEFDSPQLCVCMCVCMSLIIRRLQCVCLFAALCPEEAESALEATHFFTEDASQGDHESVLLWIDATVFALQSYTAVFLLQS